MAKQRRSNIPPPSWGQVQWLMGGGLLQVFITFLMSLYHNHIQTKDTVGKFDELFSTTYSIMVFLCIIGVSAIVLALIKIILLARISYKSKKRGKRK